MSTEAATPESTVSVEEVLYRAIRNDPRFFTLDEMVLSASDLLY